MMMGCHMGPVLSHIHPQTNLKEISCTEKRMVVASSSFLMEGKPIISLSLFFVVMTNPCSTVLGVEFFDILLPVSLLIHGTK